jgi:hypothetical protein
MNDPSISITNANNTFASYEENPCISKPIFHPAINYAAASKNRHWGHCFAVNQIFRSSFAGAIQRVRKPFDFLHQTADGSLHQMTVRAV